MQAKDGLGRYGERVAVRRLIDDGYDIVECNWRCDDGEIDIIATRDGVISFVEVKTRSSNRFGEPGEAVGLQKQKKIRELAAIWLRERGHIESGPSGLSFDVIEVRHADKGPAGVTHLREAF